MPDRYALGIRPSSPAHAAAPDGETTLCGLPLSMFGRPIRDDEQHAPCKACAHIALASVATVRRWRKAVPA